MKKITLFSFISLLTISFSASAADETSIVSIVTNSISNVAAPLILPQAITWLGSFLALQFFMNNYRLLKNGSDIPEVIAKLAGSLAWGGFVIYLINNGPDFINSVGNGVLSKYAPDIPGPGAIIASTLGICTTLIAAIFAIGIVHTAIAILLVNAVFIIFGVGIYMAIKIAMLSLELGLIVMLSPLSFSFLGLDALKDQGIAPLKSLISLVYRIILLGVICGAFGQVIDVTSSSLSSISWTNPTSWPNAINIILSMLCAYPVIGYFVFKSDAIASSLASGSTNMGPADVASAAATGASVASGGSSLANSAAKGPMAMSQVLSNMMGGGSVADASGRGSGQTPSGPAPTRSASMSAGATSTPSHGGGGRGDDGGAAPVRPAPGEQSNSGDSTIGEAPARSSLEKNATEHDSTQTDASSQDKEMADVSSEQGSALAANDSDLGGAAAPVRAGNGAGNAPSASSASGAPPRGAAGSSGIVGGPPTRSTSVGSARSGVAEGVGSRGGAVQSGVDSASDGALANAGKVMQGGLAARGGGDLGRANATAGGGAPARSNSPGSGSMPGATGNVAAGSGDAPARQASGGVKDSNTGSNNSGYSGKSEEGIPDAAQAIGQNGGAAAPVDAGGNGSGNAEPGNAPARSSGADDPGSGANASIGGAADQKMDKVLEALAQSQQPRKRTATEGLRELGEHMEKEKVATHISINTNHSD